MHRQQVLAHLGTHKTIEGAIEHAMQEEASELETEAHWLSEAERRKNYLLERYGDELGEAIPDYLSAHSTWEELERDLRLEYWRQWYMDQEVRFRWMKWWTHKWELYERILYYHKACGMAARHRQEANLHRKKLNELLEAKMNYL